MGYLFQASCMKKSRDFTSSFRYFKGPLIIIFRIDMPEGCISAFINHYIKTRTRVPEIGM